ncbi:uncharacterized protein LOC135469108 [Liolophura sinensis]|uniref:uncharacterized protein LOC135469108 n=1 Tax=Liolophura sinensis TaxID=3198878 RepID=UPI0031587DA1
MEELTDQKTMTHDKVNIGKTGAVSTHHETRLRIWASERRKVLQLQLDYHPGIVTQRAAETFLADYQEVVHFVVHSPKTPVKNIAHAVSLHSVTTPSATVDSKLSTLSHGISESTQEILFGEENTDENNTLNENGYSLDSSLSFLTVGSSYEMKIGDGCCASSWEDALLRMTLLNGRPGCLEWGLDESGSVGKMAVSQIKRVSRRSKGNIHKLEIKSSNKTLKFRTRDETLVDRWSNALDRVTRSREHQQTYVNRGAEFETDTLTTHM